jgi:4-alpha-glucanotransferase
MIVHFYLRYSSKFGQTLLVSGNADVLGNNDFTKAFSLEYLNEQFWYGSVEISQKKTEEPLNYKYILIEESGEGVFEFGDDRIIDLTKTKKDKLVLQDTWNHAGQFENAFFTAPFQDVLLNTKIKSPAHKELKIYTHEFRVKAPILNEDEIICISGSAKCLNEWDKARVLPLVKKQNWWTIRLNLAGEQFPLSYKYGVYNTNEKRFVRFEDGNNHTLLTEEAAKTITILHDGFAQVSTTGWKGAGVAIPVFSLRSKNGLGTGEFTDLKFLVDWAKKTGLKMIQILPVNDTIATNTWKDSYPYSAISAFALHPMLLNVGQVAGKDLQHIIAPLAAEQKKLNKLAHVDYEEVVRLKTGAMRQLYNLQKSSFKDDYTYITFFELNRYWLEPYAAFCYLRDKSGTADFTKWSSHTVYDETEIQQLVSPQQKHYDDIAVHYFTQYHLHLQLKAATGYAHKNGIVIKGDIPIGICRNSVDAWIEPQLYHMDEQAGAPPDAFATKGQNWGFPTYNWKLMQQDGFTWWRKRFEQMSSYFDAFRIDHILGFFRIWSIPEHAVEGVMGRFVPAIPVSINELFERKIVFERHRYTQPYVTEAILFDLFGEQKETVKKKFFNGNKLKESFNTQRKIEAYFDGNKTFGKEVKLKLFDVVSNVIFFEVPDTNGQQFHFRIAMEETYSFKYLDAHSQEELKKIYVDYFYHRQDDMWRKEAMKKLPGLKRNTNMLVCGEDLGMVPYCVPDVMQQLGILSLEIQRMPKKSGVEFFHPKDAPYLSVVTPSSHDMSTIRGWWEEDSFKTQRFYNLLLNHEGDAPEYCEPRINKEIVVQHLYSPAMWCVFQLQDLMGINASIRRKDPAEERINNPSDPDHYWNYRMHINLEDLLKKTAFNEELKSYLLASGR